MSPSAFPPKLPSPIIAKAPLGDAGKKINRVYICFSPGSLCFGGDIFRFEAFEGEMTGCLAMYEPRESCDRNKMLR